MRNLNIFWQLIRLNIKKSMIYRVNFWISFVAMVLWIGIYVVFFEILFMHVDEIAGWDKGEILVFLAFYYLVIGIGAIFYRESFETFGDKMRRGLLDYFLTKPSSKQLLLFFENIRFDHVVDFAMTIILFVYIGLTTDIVFNPVLLGTGFILALFGNLLLYSMLLMIASIVFFVEKMDSAGSFMWHLTQISRYPRQIYKGVGRLLFQFIFPVALMTSIPSEVTLNQGVTNSVLYFIGISIIFFILANLFFSYGIRRYSSAG